MEIYNEKQARINALKQLLSNTDYKALKAFEGQPSADWEDVKAKREEWRSEVDVLMRELQESETA